MITIVGAALGGLMNRPTPAQIESLKQHEHVAVVGAHTVGAPDGGAGIPVLHWSSRHGDLRVPHFFGLHAIQFVPLFAWLFRRRRALTGVFAFAGTYAATVALLTWQALAGRPLLG
jgi:hypothetical protein